MISWVKKSWKWLKYILEISGVIISIIFVAIITIIMSGKIKQKDIDNYLDKLKELKKKRDENEKNINGSNYSDYNSDGTIKRRKK